MLNKKKIKFYVDNLLGSGSNSLVIWLGVISFVFVLIVSGLTWIAKLSDHERFGDLLWDLTMRAVTPWEIEASMGSLPYLLILFTITLFGIFVLSILISFLSTIIDARVRAAGQGLQSFPFSNHIIILGWSSRVPAIVEELVAANESEENSRIVIASGLAHEDLESVISRSIYQTKNTQIYWRSRKLNSIDTFENLNVLGARRIVVLGDQSENLGEVQLERLKCTISLFNFFDGNRVTDRSLLVEAADDAEALSLLSGSRRRATPVVVSNFPARLIVETVFQPFLPSVYEEILSFEGNEIYISKDAESLDLSGLTFGEAAAHFPLSVPIGLLSSNNKTNLNPNPEYLLSASDALVVISEDDSLIRVTAPPTDQEPVNMAVRESRELDDKLKVALVGYSESSPEIVKKLLESKRCSITLLVESKEAVAEEYQTPSVTIFEGSMCNPDTLLNAGIMSMDTVIISNKSTSINSCSDLGVMRSILVINELAGVDRNPHLIVELQDSDSRDMLATLFNLDFVVSDKIGSKIFAQFIENPHLIGVIDSLVCSGNHRISIHSISIDKMIQTSFGGLRRGSLTEGRQLIGVKYIFEDQALTKLNPGDNFLIPVGTKCLEGIFVE
jgi:hypothetical protein